MSLLYLCGAVVTAGDEVVTPDGGGVVVGFRHPTLTVGGRVVVRSGDRVARFPVDQCVLARRAGAPGRRWLLLLLAGVLVFLIVRSAL